MSDIDIAREVAAELASKVKKQATGWRWAKGVVVFPDMRCPYCKQAVRSKAIWKHTDTALIGAFIPKAGEVPRLGKVEHPHARLEWAGQKICFGYHGVTDAHHALFGALNGTRDYERFVVPFLQSDIMGNHTCEQMSVVTGRRTDDDDDEPVTIWCIVCEDEVDIDDARTYRDDCYCDGCFWERFYMCEACGETGDKDDVRRSPDGQDYCDDCWANRYFSCYYCYETYKLDDRLVDPDDNVCCSDCHHERVFYCEDCDTDCWLKERAEGQDICQDCFDKDLKECVACGEEYHTEDYDQRVEHTHLKCEECDELYYLADGEHTCDAD